MLPCRKSSSSKMAVSVPAEAQPSRISAEASCWQKPCLPPERWCMLGLTFISHTPANVPFSPPSSQQFLSVPAASPLWLPVSSCNRLGGNRASSVNPKILTLSRYARFQDSSAEPRCSRLPGFISRLWHALNCWGSVWDDQRRSLIKPVQAIKPALGSLSAYP